MAEGGPPECDDQKKTISQHLKTPLKKGDTWYLLDIKWFKQWKKYVGFDSWDTSLIGDKSAYPGPIDNGPLFKDGTNELREQMLDELDYMLLPAEGWEQLVSWYSLVPGQEPVPRKVIEQGMFVKQCKVEVYLMDLKLCQNSDMDNVMTKQFSKADTIDHLEKEMKKLYNVVEDKDVRLWNKYMSNTLEHLNKKDNTLLDAGLYSGQTIIIEEQNDDGSWPRQVKSTSYSNTSTSTSVDNSSSFGSSPGRSNMSFSYANSYSGGSYYSSSSSYSDYGSTKGAQAPGLCGLSNLGNTCFMNSAIQCMSNVPHLTDYFHDDNWRDELNFDNPLGMKGEIAKAYAELIRNMWSGKYSYTVPRNFKIAVGRFAPQFSGYQQQDSQELMAFLLDGLHEDLNRIKQKPYVEQKDFDGRPDAIIAKESWENYQKRNDSVIVDIFHGLLKSTLVCPDCSKISVTFDPFCYLSLPLPISKERQIQIIFVPMDPMKKPMQYRITVPKSGKVTELCAAVGKQTGVDADRLVVTDVCRAKFNKVFYNDDRLSHITDKDDIYVYEVPVNCNDDHELLNIPVYMREKRVQYQSSSFAYSTPQLFGTPMLVPVPKTACTYEKLYNIVLNKCSRFVQLPDADEEWWKEDESPDREQENGMSINGDIDQDMRDSKISDDDDDNSSNGKDRSDENGDDEGDTEEKNHPLFSLSIVNSLGSAEMEKVQKDDKAIKLTARSYLAVDWNSKAKEKFYNENEAGEVDYHSSCKSSNYSKRPTIQLNECLELFTMKERLGADDPWYCPHCKKHKQATKKFDLWDLPNTLVIHLKRFSCSNSYAYSLHRWNKLENFVEFPVNGLDLKKYLINKDHGPAVYDLTAVSNHYGGMGGGHYTAYARNKEDNEWYHFDDSTVSQVNEDNIVTKAAYVLVYQKRDTIGTNYKMQNNKSIPAALGAPNGASETISNGNCESDDDMDTN